MIEKKLVVDENDKSTRTISIIRTLLHDPKFKEKCRTEPKFFSRNFKIDLGAVPFLPSGEIRTYFVDILVF